MYLDVKDNEIRREGFTLVDVSSIAVSSPTERYSESTLMRTDLNSLLIFARVVESKSFVKAARRLQMPTSTVSRRVAELENQLGVRLIERSTRSLRLTDVGSEILEHAQRSADVSEAVSSIASNHTTNVSGSLRISAPPSISDSVLAPLICRFQEVYPDVRVQVFITERVLDPIAEDIDLSFRVGKLEDSSLVLRRLLTYRHQLVASPAYLKGRKLPNKPQDLLDHRLLAFTFGSFQNTWSFTRRDSKDKVSIAIKPYLTINEYAGLVVALLRGVGIGELPPVVQPDLLRRRPACIFKMHRGMESQVGTAIPCQSDATPSK
jgi:DNA-binding transcriptional LysR family regulator